MKASDTEALLQSTFAALSRSHERLRELEARGRSPIAITGIGCRLPGGIEGPAALWEALERGADLVSRDSASQWNARAGVPDSQHGEASFMPAGFIDQPFAFDAAFFGISPREAELMDPQQRIILEVAYRALEDAGLGLQALRGRRVGLYIGAGANEYHRQCFQHANDRDIGYVGSGNALNAIAGRLGHFLGTHGPAIVVDTACSSSLVAVHLAVQGLRNGDCDIALAGGVNLLLDPLTSKPLKGAGMLSPDGSCRAFDRSASGYVRAEGCGVVVLKPASPLTAGEHCYATIRSVAVNHDGTSSSLTAPNGAAQQMVLSQALRSAGLEGDDIDYVETHGTGTPLGDPIELHSLDAVYGGGRSEARPLLLGALKTNTGHLEAASGIAGLIKTALCLAHGTIVPSIHFDNWNPAIQADLRKYQVVTQKRPWRAVGNHLRRAAVSAFGFSGTNAHAILEEWREPAATSKPVPPFPSILAVSGRDADAFSALCSDLALRLRGDPTQLSELALSSLLTRTEFLVRAAWIVESADEAIARLEAAAVGGVAPVARASPRIGLACAGADAAGGTPAALAQVADAIPAVREALERDELLTYLRTAEGAPESRTPWARWCSNVVYQVGVARVLAVAGIAPAVVTAENDGVLAALVIAGVVDLDVVLTVLKSPAIAEPQSGSDLAAVLARLQRETGFTARRPAMPLLLSGGVDWTDEPMTDAQWARIGRPEAATGPSAERLAAARLDGIVDARVELRMAPFDARRQDTSDLSSPTLARKIANVLVGLYGINSKVRWEELLRGVAFKQLALPGHPLRRTLYRVGFGYGSEARPGRIALADALTTQGLAVKQVTADFLSEHRVMDRPVVPGAFWVALLTDRLFESGERFATLHNLFFREILLADDGPLTLSIRAGENGQGSLGVRVHSRADHGDGPLHFSADIRLAAVAPSALRAVPTSSIAQDEGFDYATLYEEITSSSGISHGPLFQCIRDLAGNDCSYRARLVVPMALRSTAAAVERATALIDSCLQVLGIAAIRHRTGTEEGQGLIAVPFSIDELRLHAPLVANEYQCVATLRPDASAGGGLVSGNITLTGLNGAVVAELIGASFRRIDVRSFQRRAPASSVPALLAVRHESVVPQRTAADEMPTLLLAEDPAGGHALHSCTLGATGLMPGPPVHDPCLSPAALTAALSATLAHGQPVRLLFALSGAPSGGDEVHVLADRLAKLAGLLAVIEAIDAPSRRRLGSLLILLHCPPGSEALASAVGAFCRSAVRELPWVPLQVVALDEQQVLDEAAVRQITAAATHGHREIRFEDGMMRVPVLTPTSAIPTPGDKALVRPGCAYLVTGGMGSLGLKLAHWLVRQGGSTLYLLGRRPPASEAMASVAQLRALGAQIHLEPIDVSDAVRLEQFIKERVLPGPRLGGIFHCAGLVLDRPVTQLSAEAIAGVAIAKVSATLQLLRLVPRLQPDFFVAFSSATASLGNAGQAHYGAANAYMDACVAAAHAGGLPAFSTRWGPWADSRMIGTLPKTHLQALAKAGIDLLEAEEAFACMQRQIAINLPVGLILKARMPPDHVAQMALLPARPSVDVPLSKNIRGDVLKGLQERSAPQRVAYVADFLRQELTRALKLEPGQDIPLDQGFFELGLDSLAAMELRDDLEAQLAINVPPTALFSHPTLEALARHLVEKLVDPPEARNTGSSVATEAHPTGEEARDLAHELRLLDEKLRELDA